MSDVENREYSAGGSIHPNMKSYRMASPQSGIGTPGLRTIRRAVLYSTKRTEEPKSTGTDGGFWGSNTGGEDVAGKTLGTRMLGGGQGHTEIVTTLKKPFQYNPPNLLMGIQMSPVDHEDSLTPGGNLGTDMTLGSAGSSIEMMFDRTMEVFAGVRSISKEHSEYARLGVAKDILDVYAVLSGDPAMLEASDGKSIAALTREMSDLVTHGSSVVMKTGAAISYSENLVIFGMVTSLSLRFLQFTRDLVPTFGYCHLQFDIYNAGNKGLVANRMGVTDPTSSLNAATGARSATTSRTVAQGNANIQNTAAGWWAQ